MERGAMIPRCWFDLHLVNSGDASGVPQPILLSKVLMVCHGYFAKQVGKYAIALPDAALSGSPLPGSTLRVFSANEQELIEMWSGIREHYLIRDYTTSTMPNKVPSSFAGPYVEFRRFRIGPAKSDRNQTSLRERRLEQARPLPYFQMRSKSSSSYFRLIVEPRIDKDGALRAISPDSYGLSVATRSFSLPMVGCS